MHSFQRLLINKNGVVKENLIFFDSLHNYVEILFGKKSYYTNRLNYVIIFQVVAEMSVLLVDVSREKSLKNFDH